MSTIAGVLVALVALEHLYILWIEMFAWTTKGKEVFRDALPEELFEPTRGLAANQGLYNGFLAMGLIWGLMIGDLEWSIRVQTFFLGCVIVAATYGALRLSHSILIKQGLPAILALLALLLAQA
jgi:integral membrane protein